MKQLFLNIALCTSLHTTAQTPTPFDATQLHFISGVSEETPEFLTMQGWHREPLAQYLCVPDHIMYPLYNPVVPALSSAAYYGTTPIGCRDVYWFKKDYLDVFPENKAKTQALNPDEKSVQFMRILQASYDYESDIIVKKCHELNIPLDKVAKNVGLMILQDFSGYGIATTLQAENLHHLRTLGVQAIVCDTTNPISARVMQKNGFTLCHQFSYENDFGLLGMPGHWTIWFLVL